MKTHHWLWLIGFLALLALPAGAQTAPRYKLTLLPLDFSGYNVIESEDHTGGINAQGQIVGSYSVRTGRLQDNRIALWQKGHRLRILDKRPVTREDDESNRDFLYPTAINMRGETLGIREFSTSGAYMIGFSTAYLLWNGRLHRLDSGFPSDPNTASSALGQNDQCEIVGIFI